MDKQTDRPDSKDLEERHEDMLIAVKREVRDGKTRGVRSSLAAAFLEDEAVRLAAEENARSYVEKREDEQSGMPQWTWYLLFFLLGMLFSISITPLQLMIAELMEYI